jgi:hypothetical protein
MFPKRSTTSRWTVSRRVGSGAQLGRRLLADEVPPLLRVVPREQFGERHVDEVRVAVPGLTVGERKLRALGHDVDVRKFESLEEA